MTGYVLSPAAAADLAAIWRYSIANWSREQADRYINEIKAGCEALAAGTRKGRTIDFVRLGYCKFSVGSHFLVYRVLDDRINIVRILHQRMNIDSHLEG